MNVLVLGNGGRENALARKAYNSPLTNNVYVIPGNSGMEEELIVFDDIDDKNFEELEQFCIKHEIKLIIVGNEAYLELGVVDYFNNTNIKIFGPTIEGAKIETSKDFAKGLMKKYNIPTANYNTFTSEEEALNHLENSSLPVVIKQDGLALGKGVLVSSDYNEAKQFVIDSFKTNDKVIFEEFLDGEEFSLLCFVNGETYANMQVARDYKRAFDNDEGLNTGGMGCFTPVPDILHSDIEYSLKEIIEKTLSGLKSENIFYKGILYAGLIKTKDGIKVIEFNARFGDPETEVLMEAMNSDLIETILNILDNKKVTLDWKKGATIGVCLASKGYPLNYEKGIEIDIQKDVPFYSMALKKENNKFYNNGGRVMFVFANGENYKDAREKVYKNVEKVHSSGLFYRNDIGKLD